MSFEKPYEGLLVIDMSQGVAGPYCGMLLARHGARVIKVEPLEGDWARIIGPQYGDHTAYSVGANVGKESLVVDLKTEAGRAIVDELLPAAAVFLEGFRPGVIDRLGFGWERLHALNPGLVYLSISGFGQRGPLAEKPAMDPVLQAFTGFMTENKGIVDGIPHRTPTIIIDMATALYSQQAVAAALYARAMDPAKRGRRIEASLMEAAANLQYVRLASAIREGELKIAGAPSGTYRTKDGWVQMVSIKNREFQAICRALGLAEAAVDPRFASNAGRIEHAVQLNGLAAGVLAGLTAEEARARLTAERVQNEVVQTYQQFAAHPHTEAMGTISWLTQPGSEKPWAVANPPGLAKLEAGSPEAHAPRKGEHTRAILTELGHDAADIAGLVRDEVVIAG